ncbi:hypothetical protein OU994_29745 [Pseudoduganella sp. SL102]|uniref:hypothetical protein n=1 Tax=Pseudoduganella sp. SL102 TaxID=2995154 RepID=UPI00248B3EDF|nr:hypothetical protein [Pseudoduganella sp. SL102]WBS02377.1 hypothetical protein OU994_29745 [Pseudoduganella sp. SL102]
MESILHWWPWIVIVAGISLLFWTYHRQRKLAALEEEFRATLEYPLPTECRGYLPFGEDDVEAPAASQISPPEEGPHRYAPSVSHQVVMSIIVTLAILAAALYVVLAQQAYSDAHQKWAFGAIGTIVGYWLKK